MESQKRINNMDVIFVKEFKELNPEYTSFLLAKEDRINDYLVETIDG